MIKLLRRNCEQNERRQTGLSLVSAMVGVFLSLTMVAIAMSLFGRAIQGPSGGDLDNTVRNGLDSQGWGLLINSSRAILYASNGPKFAQAAGQEAERTRSAIQIAKQSALSG